MPKQITPAKAVLIITLGFILLFSGYWFAWSRGFVIVSANGTHQERYIVREIPISTGPLSMVLGLNDSYLYRMEVWRFPHCITDCKTSHGDSYRAKAARIEVTAKRCTFYLDGTPWMSFSSQGEWSRE